MNEYLQEYILLKKNYEAQDGDRLSVLALYQFADRIIASEQQQAQPVLVNVYQLLGMMKSAYDLLTSLADKTDRKQLKKLAQLQKLSVSHADCYALPRPMGDKEQSAQKERMKHLPQFRYHPDPLGTGAFIEDEAKTCPCCANKSTVYSSTMPYCIESVEYLCPNCIASGRATKKYDANFVQDSEWEGERDQEKDDELFHRTPGYISWQGEHWLSCCEDYCAYLGTVGTRELKAMGIAETVFAQYASHHEFTNVEQFLVKDGSLCGYLFQCIHCSNYQLWVDAD